jgi:hypothetical protein
MSMHQASQRPGQCPLQFILLCKALLRQEIPVCDWAVSKEQMRMVPHARPCAAACGYIGNQTEYRQTARAEEEE